MLVQQAPLGPTSTEAAQFLEDAIFAVKHGNVPFLALLLGNAEEQREADLKIVQLGHERIRLTAQRDAIFGKAFSRCKEIGGLIGEAMPDVENINVEDIEHINKFIKTAENFLSQGGVRRMMLEAYRMVNAANMERARQHDHAYRTHYVNGHEREINPEQRQEGAQAYDEYIRKIELAHFASDQVQAEIQEKIKQIQKMIDAVKLIVAEYEVAFAAVHANADEDADIKNNIKMIREAKVAQIVSIMGEKPEDMPERYRELFNLDDQHKLLKALLQNASGANVNTAQVDRHGNTLLFYALEAKEPIIAILELLVSHGALLTLLQPGPSSRQPYRFIVRNGNNEIARLFINHHMRGIAKLNPGRPGFMNAETIQHYMIIQQQLLENFYVDLMAYFNVTLPLTEASFFSNQNYIQQRKALWEQFSELFSQAVAINSWFIVGDAIEPFKEAISKHTRWWTGHRSRLRDIFEKHEREANRQLDKVSNWGIIAQLQELMQDYQQATSRLEEDLATANSEISKLRGHVAEQGVELSALQREVAELRDLVNLLLREKTYSHRNGSDQKNDRSQTPPNESDQSANEDTPPTSPRFTPGYNEGQGGSSSSQSNNGQREQTEGAQHRL